jgi:L-threonylcarbamoyladenylate synthase
MIRAFDLSIQTWFVEDLPSLVDRALSIMRTGGVVAAPTDTVYGLLARASSTRAIEAVFGLKARPRDVSLPVLVSGSDQAVEDCGIECGDSMDRMMILARRFWPGSLTLVVDAEQNAITSQVSDGCSIAVRAPEGDLLRALLSDEPLVGTSANLHGSAPGTNGQETLDGLLAAEGRSLEMLHALGLGLVIDGLAGGSQSSTVVDLRGASPVILRRGPITESEIMDALDEFSPRESYSS